MKELANQLATLRPRLLRAARRRLRNRAWADDAVSETLVAALEKQPVFTAPAQLEAWLVGVLKHKLADQLRLQARERTWDGEAFEFDALADTVSAWNVGGSAHADPQDRLGDRQFVEQLDRSVRDLPGRLGRAFVLSDCLGVDTDDVCRELGVSANNLAVMRHRARARLRASMQAHRSPSAPPTRRVVND